MAGTAAGGQAMTADTDAFREIPATWVEPSTVVLVEVVTAAAARDLGLRRPSIQYVARGTYPGAKVAFRWPWIMGFRERLAGRVSLGGGTIYLDHGLGQPEAMTTAVHEVRHAYQKAHPGLFRGWDHDDLEDDAERYALGWIRKFHARS